ncbi:MAG: DUF1385 domain-containing protein, partial [Lachnospiraceae bacterium]|nr:DUF1385 domain-containing protein [Lachnospiraceae bacterium]
NNDKYAVAVRKPDKEIELKVTEYTPIGEKCKIFKWPIIRGVFNFIDSLIVGMKTLMYSGEFIEEEEITKNTKASKTEEADAAAMSGKEEKSGGMDGASIFFTLAFSIILAIGLFMLLPAFLVSLLDGIIDNHFVLSLIEGVVRLAIFMLYVLGISLMQDIKRTFMYHGAEHKTINCLEHNLELTVENVMSQSRFHKRCGTSFLFIVMIVSIFVFMFIKTDIIWLRLVSRVLLVPLVAGISYEFIRFAGRSDSAFANILSQPGLWVQRITTKEPTPDMIEVAIRSVEGVLDWRAYLEEQRTDG